jgi:UDP-perosamine 4-acetyltransferase
VGLGAGGHARVVLDLISLLPGWIVEALVDVDPTLHGSRVGGVPVVGGDGRLRQLLDAGITHGFVGVGSVAAPDARIRMFDVGRELGLLWVPAIHPRSIVAASVTIGQAPTVVGGAVINSDTVLGDNVLVNTAAVVDHDCVLGDHVHIAPGATLSGGVSVGRAAHVGVGATVLEGIRIGEGAVVAAGAVVLRDVAPDTTVAGVPAREIPRRGDGGRPPAGA